MHGTLWIEEAADAFEALGADMEDFLFPLVRKVRSAGWRVVYSLHRASYDQMPTFLRGMVSRTTMGVREHDDARFGLSPVQIEADCSPELWADNPEDRGKFYRDAPPMAREYRTMAGRFYDWGPGTKTMAAHAAAYPASARPWDAVTAPYFAELMGAPAPAEPPARPSVTLTRDHQEDDMDGYDPRDDGPLDPDEIEDGDLSLGAPATAGPEVPPSAELALDTVRKQIREWRARGGVPQRRGGPAPKVTIADLRPLAEQLGRQRTWLYWVMPKLEAEREIRRNADGDGWEILDRAA
jgi:hypothetical protein